MVQVAFLRAVNVGGSAVISMHDLRHLFVSAGCKDVRTYIQSGNVLFTATRPESKALSQRIQRTISDHLGHEVAVAYRTETELKEVVAIKPFGPLVSGPDVKLYVGFLTAAPSRVPRLPFSMAREGLEITRATKGEVFVVSRRVNGRFGFPNLLIEKEYGVPATTRNWNTVLKILSLASE